MAGQNERRGSAKGDREKEAAAAAKKEEEEKKDDKAKYYNDIYTYQKLKSLKWMGGPYKSNTDQSNPIWKPSAEEQAIMDQLAAKREIKAKYNLLSLNKEEQTQLYKYILLGGNNHDVVRRVMDTRPSWACIKSSQTLYHFKWAPVSRQIKFDFLCKHGQKNLVNHFENHALISTKDQLFHNMTKLTENMHTDVFDFMPITFVIDLGTSMCSSEYDKFNYFFNMIEKTKPAYGEAMSNPDTKSEILNGLNKTITAH